VLRATSWVVSCCAAASLILDESLLGGPSSATVYENPLPMVASFRILACAAFAARSAQALLASMSVSARYAVTSGSVPQHAADQLRHGARLAGALLLLGPWALPLLLPGRHEALVLALDRFATVALASSAFLLSAPPLATSFDEDPPIDGYKSISELAAARRAARLAAEKEKREPAPEPLMRESWSGKGGIQSFGDVDAALRTDEDGDEAHEFWAETPEGVLQLAAPQPTAGATAKGGKA